MTDVRFRHTADNDTWCDEEHPCRKCDRITFLLQENKQLNNKLAGILLALQKVLKENEGRMLWD